MVSVEKALKEKGITGRPTSNYLVKWNDNNLDTTKKVEDFKFPEDVKIFISLKSGEGGSGKK